MSTYLQSLRKRYHWIDLTHVIVLLAISAGVTYYFRESAMMLHEPFAIDSTFNVINLIATTLIYGVPFTLGAVILWNTKFAHQNLIESIVSSKNIKRVYLERLVISSTISFLFMVGICIVGYVMKGANIIYLPTILLSALIVSYILNIMTFSLALFVDSPALTILFGTGIFSLFAFQLGWSPFSALSETSLYAPYHLFRYLAWILTGYQFSNEHLMEDYVGIAIQPLSMVGPLLAWVLLSLLFVYVSMYFIQEGLPRWEEEQHTWDKEQSSAEVFQTNKLFTVNNRRKMLAVGIIILLVSIAAFNVFTTSSQNQIPEDLILYRSPENGEIIELGSWRYNTVDVTATQISNADGWVLSVTVLEWGEYGGGDGLDIRYRFLVLSLFEFEAMNQTERESVIVSIAHGITPEHPTGGTGTHTSLEGADTYLWAIQITDSANANATYSIKIYIDLYLHPE